MLTHHPPAEVVPGLTFVTGFDAAVDEAAAAAGDKYVAILGADVAAQCLRAGVLDEVLVSVVPVLLGEGTRLFEHPGGATVKLQPLQRNPHAEWDEPVVPRHRAARASA